MNFEIRTSKADDADAVSELLLRSYSELLRPFYDASLLRKALPLMSRANPRLLTSGTWYLAVDKQGGLLGCGGWTLDDPVSLKRQEGLAHVRHFACHPEHLRKGIAGKLVAHSLEQAAQAGAKEYECCSTLNAEPFYAGFGFKRVRLVTVAFSADVGFPSVLMRRGME